MLENLITKNRSCRRFFQKEPVMTETLKRLVNLARLSASAANLQPLKYILLNDPDKNELIFSCLAWAGYLKDWPGPPEGERPSAYIIVVGDTKIAKTFATDLGIAAQSILLGAREDNLKIIHVVKKNVWEMYDLAADPGEVKNLISTEEARAKEMQAVLQRIRQEGRSRKP